MRTTSTPVGVVFDLQRNAIEQTSQALKRGLETQREFAGMVLESTSATQVNERTYDVARRIVASYFQAIDAAMPGQSGQLDDVHATVTDQLETLEATQAEVIEAFEVTVQEGTELTDELTEESVESLDKQVEMALEVNEDLEDQTLEVLQEFDGAMEELQTEFAAQREEVTESVQEQLEQFATQATDVQEEIEDVAHEITDETEAEDGTQPEAAERSLEAIDGLGPTYAKRLHGQGIDSFAALAEAAAETVAEAAEVPESQAEAWIEAAQSA